MARESAASRRARVKLQLRDKHGRWIEMGGGVKWYSSRLKKQVAGTVVGTQGANALVRLNKENPTHEPALVKVPAHNISVIDSKGKISLPGEEKSNADTPEFEEPEAVGRVEPESPTAVATDSVDDWSITDTSDGNTYVSRSGEGELYTPARDLQVGDEIIAPGGADPLKPFSMGRSWATKKAERLNNDGPKLGKVVDIVDDRYAVVQIAGDHTVPNRHGEQSDVVTVGLDSNVLRVTPGLREALGDKLSDSNFGESEVDDQEIDANAPDAQSDHIGREVPEDQIDSVEDPSEAPEEAVDVPEAQEAPAAPEEPEAAPQEAPEAPEEAPKADDPEADSEKDVVEGISQIAQDMEDIADYELEGSDLTDALEEAKYSFRANDGLEYTVSGQQEGDGEYSYNVTDFEGKDVGNWNAGSYNSPEEVAKDIFNTINKRRSDDPEASENTSADVDAPAAPSYNENGLTEEEQKNADAYVRMANRAFERFDDEGGNRYQGLADDLFKLGESRKGDSDPEASEPEAAPSAPETAPSAPEEAPEAEVSPAPARGQNYSEMSPQDKIDAAEEMYGTGSRQHKQAQERWGKEAEEAAAPVSEDATEEDVDTVENFLNGYAPENDTGIRRLKQNVDDYDYTMDNTTKELIESLPIGSVLETTDEERRDAFKPYVKVGENHWMEDPGFGSRAQDIDHDDNFMLDEVPQGLFLPGNAKNPFTEEDISRLLDRFSRRPASTPELPAEAAPALAQKYLSERGTARELNDFMGEGGEAQSGVRINGNYAEVTDIDKAQEFLRNYLNDLSQKMSSPTTSRNQRIHYNRSDRDVRSLLRSVNDLHNHRDHQPQEASEADAPEVTTPDAVPSMDGSSSGEPENFGLRIERNPSTGLETPVLDEKDLLDEDESKEFARLAGNFLYNQHAGSNGQISNARTALQEFESKVKNRLSSGNGGDGGDEPPVDEEKLGNGENLTPIDGRGRPEVQKRMEESKAKREKEVADSAPVAVESNTMSETDSAAPEVDPENPLPAHIERHVPEAIEGEDYAPTQQQQDVIDAVLGGLDTLVQAKAGAGKTSTLRAIARRLKLARPDDKIGYIAFNKTVQLEANGSMPDNTEARTGHSVAMAWAPEWMRKRLKWENGFLSRPSDIANHLGISTAMDDNGKRFSTNSQAMAVKRTIASFANSADDNITLDHLPESVKEMSPQNQNAILAFANAAWADMQSKDGKLKMSFDEIRKNWALSRPDFSKPGSGLSRPVNVLFLDEAQDTPPVLAKVIADQSIQKVIVGDADQAIYGFTGATDYLSNAQGDVELPLNKSWRFGPQVADMGNRFLQLVGSRQRVIGGGESAIVDNMQNADAVLVRSNGGMLTEIARELQDGRVVGVPKDTKKDLQSLIQTARYIRGEGRAPAIMHEDLADFRSWGEFLKEEEKGDDQNLSKIKRMIDNFGLDKMSELVDSIVETGSGVFDHITFENHDSGLVARGDTFPAKDFLKDAGFRWIVDPNGGLITRGRNRGEPQRVWAATGTPEEREAKLAKARELAGTADPDVVISTAHKSKGLEWDRVRIGDDFWGPKVDENGEVTEMPKDEELRLNYVAVTRAAKELDLGSLAWVLDHTDENGGEPESSRSSEPDAPSLQESDETHAVKDFTKPEEETEEPVSDESGAISEFFPRDDFDSTPEVENAPAEEVAPEVPAMSENGLTETEQAYLDDLDQRSYDAYRGRSNEDIEELEREINDLLIHGESRLKGEDRGEYTPTISRGADEEEVIEPVETLPEPVPMGRRTRQDYSGAPVLDKDGNDLATGDMIGHPSLGPVQITGLVPSSGRVQFINPNTGKTGSVKAANVSRIDPDAPADVESPAVENIPTTPGEMFVDTATGLKAFVGINGEKIVIGDTVTTRDGRTGIVKARYRGADGMASVAIDFGDGARTLPRIKGALLSKGGNDEATPDTEAPEASVPDAPEAPRVGNEPPRLDEFRSAPIGSEFESWTGRSFVKIGENQWRGDVPDFDYTDYDIALMDASSPESSVPEPTVEEVIPETPALDPRFHNKELRDISIEREDILENAPVGSEVVHNNSGMTYVKQDNGSWYSDALGIELGLQQVTMITAPGQSTGAWTINPNGLVDQNSDVPQGMFAEMGPDTRADSDAMYRRAQFMDAPVGTKISYGSITYAKTAPNEWRDMDGDDRETFFTDSSMTMLTNDNWTFNKSPEPDAQAWTPPAGMSAFPENRTDRFGTLADLSEGSEIFSGRGTKLYTQNSSGNWVDGYGEEYTTDQIASMLDPRMGNFGYVDAAGDENMSPTVEHDLSPIRTTRQRILQQAPIGSQIISNGTHYVKVGDNVWDELTGRIYGYDSEGVATITRPSVDRGAYHYIPGTDTDDSAGPVQTVNSSLPEGTFIPNMEGSSSGLKKVGPDRWEMHLNGAPTGRFSNDETAQMMADMNGVSPVKPEVSREADFGNVDYGVSNIGFGDFMVNNFDRFNQLTEEQKREFTEGYRRFTEDMSSKLPEGVTAVMKTPHFSSYMVSVETEFFKNGRSIGSATRQFMSADDPRTGERVSRVEHALYQLSDRGQGISSAFLKASKQFYRQLGLNRITIHAALSHGGYAWARGGFDFQSYEAMQGAISNWRDRMQRGDLSIEEFVRYRREFEQLAARATPESYANGTHPAPIEFTMIGRPDGPTTADDRWFGKNFMLGSDWFGEFVLNPEGTPNPYTTGSEVASQAVGAV